MNITPLSPEHVEQRIEQQAIIENNAHSKMPQPLLTAFVDVQAYLQEQKQQQQMQVIGEMGTSGGGGGGSGGIGVGGSSGQTLPKQTPPTIVSLCRPIKI